MEEYYSLRRGFMAAFAVSGGVAFIAMYAHKRLLSDFINKMEFQTKDRDLKDVPKKKTKKKKKKVRFSDVAAESTPQKHSRPRNNGEVLEAMPQNWQVLYRGILQRRRISRG